MIQLTRETTLSKLQQIAQKRLGGAVLLFGEAGVGKTFTAKKMLAQTSCLQIELQARQSLDVLLAKLPKSKRSSSLLEKALQQFQEDSWINPETLLEVLIPHLKNFAPILLYVEDVHEATGQILEFWQKFSFATQTIKGIGILMSSRTLQPANIQFYRVPQLSFEQVSQLLEAQVKASLPPEAIGFIYERSVGNPLFALQYFGYLGRLGAIWHNTERWCFQRPSQQELPPTVEFLIADALQLEDVHAQQVLSVFALLATQEVSESTIAQVLELPTSVIKAGLLVLNHAGITHQNTLIHPLFREVALTLLPKDILRQTVLGLLRVYQDDPMQIANLLDTSVLTEQEVQHLIEQNLTYAERVELYTFQGLLLARQTKFLNGDKLAKTAHEAAFLLSQDHGALAIEMAQLASLTSAHLSHILRWIDLIATHQGLVGLEKWYDHYIDSYKNLPYSWTDAILLAYYFKKHQYDDVIELWGKISKHQSHLDSHIFQYVAASYLNINDFKKYDLFYKKYTQRLSENNLLRLMTLGSVFYRNSYKINHITISAKNEVEAIIQSSNFVKKYAINIQFYLFCYNFYNKDREIQSDIIECEKMLKKLIQLKKNAHITRCLVDYSKLLSLNGNFEENNQIILDFHPLINEKKIFYLFFLESYLLFMPFAKEKFPNSPKLFLSQLKKLFENTMFSNEISAKYSLVNLEIYFGKKEEALKILEELKNTELDDPELKYSLYYYYSLYYVEAKKDQLAIGSQLLAEKIYQEHQMQNLSVHRIQHQVLKAIVHKDLEQAKSAIVEIEKKEFFGYLSMIYYYFPSLKPMWEQATFEDATPIASSYTLKTFGRVQVLKEGVALSFSSVLGKKLLVLLLEAQIQGKAGLSKFDLCGKLFSHLDEVSALDSLYALVYRIRNQLDGKVIISNGEIYQLAKIESDLAQFFHFGNLLVCSGAYLEDIDIDSEIRDELVELLKFHCQENLERQPKEVSRVCKILIEMEPYDRDILRLALQALKASRIRSTRIEQFYQQAIDRFRELGEALPQQWQEFVDSNALEQQKYQYQ